MPSTQRSRWCDTCCAMGCHNVLNRPSPRPTNSRTFYTLQAKVDEDNLVNQRVAMTMLGKMEHRITLATNGLDLSTPCSRSDTT
jgi:hypothetical protein